MNTDRSLILRGIWNILDVKFKVIDSSCVGMTFDNNSLVLKKIGFPLLRRGLGDSLFIIILFLFTFSLSTIPLHAQETTVMTYNIRLNLASDGENAWPNRKDFLTDQIIFYAPDIFGVQEALPEQMDQISEALPEYGVVGHGRDGGNKGEYSAIFYNTNVYKVERDSTFWLSPTPDKVSKGWDAAYPRICTYGLFIHLETLEKIWVFNTHLDHVGQQARVNGMKMILEHIKSIDSDNQRALLMGDLNVEPDNEVIGLLKSAMDDSKEKAALTFGPEGTFTGFKYGLDNIRRIDYIFVSKSDELAVEKYAVLVDSKDKRYPSDHFPVLVQLELK